MPSKDAGHMSGRKKEAAVENAALMAESNLRLERTCFSHCICIIIKLHWLRGLIPIRQLAGNSSLPSLIAEPSR